MFSGFKQLGLAYVMYTDYDDPSRFKPQLSASGSRPDWPETTAIAGQTGVRLCSTGEPYGSAEGF